jgi:hypothetical protein
MLIITQLSFRTEVGAFPTVVEKSRRWADMVLSFLNELLVSNRMRFLHSERKSTALRSK